ncbi:DUF4199 domain-containing protein [Mucilaginibacter terrigena]|uniref:DUF4199 domain-containing protein n=1 Tax=Mucilaginibacter terrigena TaxID=2492395 RepID=A0A4Q5LSG4_9SPHI|nr:DUF4199 domain-containing protein [Mucilaginibacter terrigena]RYU92528.1 DUF4199 domain-containing protein [Mucilaginibacter terrigena]
METKAPNPTIIATKWALFYLGVSIVLTYTYEFLHLAQDSPIKYISYLPFIGFCFLAQKEYKDQLGGFITFGQAFNPGFRYALFSGLLTAVFLYLYLSVLSPGTMQQIVDAQGAKLAEQNQSQETIDKAAEMTLKYGAVIGSVVAAIGTLIFGCIVALIGAAILKKERTAYDIIDETPTDPTL